MTTIQTVARELADSFESFKRDGSDDLNYKIKNDAPAWLKDKDSNHAGFSLRVHEALDDRMPDDWVYSIMAHGADSLAEYEDEDSMRDAVGEIAHRVIMEKHLGRTLEPWELVHHINGNITDNRVENLQVMEFGQHAAHHHNGKRRDADTKRSFEAFALMRETLKRERQCKAELLEALRLCHAEFVKAMRLLGECQAISRKDLDVFKDGTGDQCRAALQKATGGK